MSSSSTIASAAAVREIRRAQRADGPATILAIGTANPPNCVSQDDYPDYYFRVTKSEHLTDLKESFRKLCKKTGPKKRFFHHTEELLNAHPAFLDRARPSLDARLEIAASATPKLAASAAIKAIAKWGRPATDLTHLIVSTNMVVNVPGVDLRLASLLGLPGSVIRTMLHLNGCCAGNTALRLAKDIAENNSGARVLVVCVELTIVAFRAPEEPPHPTLIMQATFGDGAGAVVVGADAVHNVERPLFEMVSVSQTVVPGTDQAITMQLMEHGLDLHIFTKGLIPIAADNIHECLSDAFGALGGVAIEWNDLFWAVHPGMRAIIDHIDTTLRLDPKKLEASRTVLRDYGNMFSATVIFVLDEQRRRMEEDGEGGEWGVTMGFGPGFTIETMVLHASSNLKTK